MDLAPNTSAALAVVALSAAVLAVAIAMGAQVRLCRTQARYRVLRAGGERTWPQFFRIGRARS